MKVLALMLIAFAIGACKPAAETAATTAPVVDTAGTTDTAQATAIENPFVTTAGQAGAFEIAAGQVALTNSANRAVDSFGYRMITSHTELGNELKAIAAKMGLLFPPSMGPANEGILADLQKLTGAAFDKPYVDHMVERHVEAVQAFETESRATPETELTRWARKSLPMIQEHLRLARELQSSLR
jgi:putative membrane protein